MKSVLEDLTSFVDFSLFAQTAAIGRTKFPGPFADDALRAIGVAMLMIGARESRRSCNGRGIGTYGRRA